MNRHLIVFKVLPFLGLVALLENLLKVLWFILICHSVLFCSVLLCCVLVCLFSAFFFISSLFVLFVIPFHNLSSTPIFSFNIFLSSPFRPFPTSLMPFSYKIRMDAWHLCTFKQRPHISIAEDVGTYVTTISQTLAYVLHMYALTRTHIRYRVCTHHALKIARQLEQIWHLPFSPSCSTSLPLTLPSYLFSFPSNSLLPSLPSTPSFQISHSSHSFTHLTLTHLSGGWATLMDLMSSMGIVCSVAIICFASQEFEDYSIYYKTVIFLVAEQSLLLMKVFIQFMFPGEAAWVEELAARNVHIWWEFHYYWCCCCCRCSCSCSCCCCCCRCQHDYLPCIMCFDLFLFLHSSCDILLDYMECLALSA